MTQSELFMRIKRGTYTTVGDSMEYCITELGGRPALLFQGSMNFRDYVNDFRFARKLYKNQTSCMVVHRGFGHVWKSGNDQVMLEFIRKCAEAKKKPIIAGWSMGGALALLAAEDLHFRSGLSADVFTFGAPKLCGNRLTAAYLRGCCCAVQYAQPNDIVPALPPLPGFRHVNKVSVGERFSLLKIWHVKDYHTGYGKTGLYD